MSNPTSNFGWQMPTPTDLVTDLPADFEVFGQAVDTSLADLKGGTTGQVLSKTTNADMDFTWVAPTAGDIEGVTAGVGISGGGTSGTVTITNDMATTITASGDIVVGTGSGTYDNLPIGTTGQVLTADTTVSPYKVKWNSPSSGGMTLLSTTSLSGTSTSVSITGTGYVGLYITVSDMSVSQAGQMYFRLNSDAGSNQYRWTGTFLDGTTNALSSGVNTAVVQSFNAETTQTDMYWNIQIFNSEDTATYKAGRWMTMQNRYSDNRIDLEGGIFSYQSTSAISNFTIYTGTAGTFSAGSIKVYGVK